MAAEKNTKEAQLEAENAALLKQVAELTKQVKGFISGNLKPGMFQNSYLVQPPKKINEMTKCEYFSWRLKELRARLKQEGLSEDQKRLYNNNIAKAEKKFLEFHLQTESVDLSHANEFSKEIKAIKKNPTQIIKAQTKA